MARKILLADDSVTAQNMGRKILADAGYEVITVNNGSAALKKIAELKPDLVILDVYMPGYSGLEVCQRLKESSDSSRIPVLLTVGKLEPFKPEEAQRVRAEGFIVKPFEASELLAALSKLEDKVVPRSEPSKPGRFARAVAAVEEADFGRGSEFGEADDNGWKSRIAFPHKKTESEAAEEKVSDDASIYNPVNRDLRTVVETPAQAIEEGKEFKKYNRRKGDQINSERAEEPTVDVAALAPAGLPQDVTAEEVAAIAAAAAQIKSLQAAFEHETPEPATIEPATEKETLPGRQVVEAEVPESRLAETSVREAQAVVTEGAAMAEPRPLSEPLPVPVEIGKPAESALPSIATEAKEMEAQPQPKEKDKEEDIPEAPVTMAVAAEVAATVDATSSQWTAVSVALDADEATLSLEHEMQKAYAAFVAEETAAAKSIPTPEPAPQNISLAEEKSPAVIEAVVSPEPEAVPAAQLLPETEPVATLQPDSTISLPQPSVEPTVMAAAELTAVETHLDSVQLDQAVESEVEVAPELVAPAAAEIISQPGEGTAVSVLAAAPQVQPEPEAAPVQAVASHRPFTSFVPATDRKPDSDRKEEDQSRADQEEARKKEDREQYLTKEDRPKEDRPREDRPEARKEETRWSPVSHEPDPQEDPETVKTTAAAWASWRQIRDAGVPKPVAAQPVDREIEAAATEPAAAAAMAVAAGAEQRKSSTELSGDVASIVEGLLADLRPKLMAEISRKMSEKK